MGQAFTTDERWVIFDNDNEKSIRWLNYGYASHIIMLESSNTILSYYANTSMGSDKNLSYIDYSGSDMIVTSVNVIDILYPENLILVDTTTLGT